MTGSGTGRGTAAIMDAPAVGVAPTTRILGLFGFPGMDGFGLTSLDNPRVFGPLALAGIALSGTAWILLGFDLAVRKSGPASLHPPRRR
jgi:hypothetical protein